MVKEEGGGGAKKCEGGHRIEEQLPNVREKPALKNLAKKNRRTGELRRFSVAYGNYVLNYAFLELAFPTSVWACRRMYASMAPVMEGALG